MATIATYEDYLNEKSSLTLEEMQEIHNLMAEAAYIDEDAQELYNDLLNAAIKYADIRANWQLLSREEKQEKDASRTACHDAVIVNLNAFCRYLNLQGKETVWRDTLGDEEADPYNRKRIGDFACYLTFISGLFAR